jgi:SPX domain protein involved in polyphosphate accumulation
MKFSEHLWKHLTPEWHSQYIPYDEMKEILYGWIEKAQQLPDVNDILLREQLFLHADEEFFQVTKKYLIELI